MVLINFLLIIVMNQFFAVVYSLVAFKLLIFLPEHFVLCHFDCHSL